MEHQITYYLLWINIIKTDEVLNIAKRLGYTESNPVDDLNGNDVAAKLKIYHLFVLTHF